MAAALALTAGLATAPLRAHPGKRDARGGHFDRATGRYHFHHRRPGAEPPAAAALPAAPTGLAQAARPGRALTRKKPAKPVEQQTRAELFGRWTDGDHDCQSTRDEILVRDNRGKLVYAARGSCRVLSGHWTCPYSGVQLRMATDLAIDHVVPLAHAMECGAGAWTREQRMAFANDPENLIAVERHINESKGAKGVVKWKPPEIDFWPEYARRWKAIKLKYGLTISPLEAKHLEKMLR